MDCLRFEWVYYMDLIYFSWMFMDLACQDDLKMDLIDWMALPLIGWLYGCDGCLLTHHELDDVFMDLMGLSWIWWIPIYWIALTWIGGLDGLTIIWIGWNCHGLDDLTMDWITSPWIGLLSVWASPPCVWTSYITKRRHHETWRWRHLRYNCRTGSL